LTTRVPVLLPLRLAGRAGLTAGICSVKRPGNLPDDHQAQAGGGLTLVIISHDLDLIRRYAEVVMVIAAGRFVAAGRSSRPDRPAAALVGRASRRCPGADRSAGTAGPSAWWPRACPAGGWLGG
jgi:hypothetical protein